MGSIVETVVGMSFLDWAELFGWIFVFAWGFALDEKTTRLAQRVRELESRVDGRSGDRRPMNPSVLG